MSLRHLKHVLVSFKSGDPGSTSARVLLQRLGGDGAKRSNPACKVEFEVGEGRAGGGAEGSPNAAFVELEFLDGDKRRIATAGRLATDIEKIIEQKGAEMDMRAVFNEVCLWKYAPRS
jgi:large subunit ribosomal protein L53